MKAPMFIKHLARYLSGGEHNEPGLEQRQSFVFQCDTSWEAASKMLGKWYGIVIPKFIAAIIWQGMAELYMQLAVVSEVMRKLRNHLSISSSTIFFFV